MPLTKEQTRLMGYILNHAIINDVVPPKDIRTLLELIQIFDPLVRRPK